MFFLIFIKFFLVYKKKPSYNQNLNPDSLLLNQQNPFFEFLSSYFKKLLKNEKRVDFGINVHNNYYDTYLFCK